jgi:predicted amidohydrolase
MDDITVALVQSAPIWKDIGANIDLHQRMLEGVSADVIVLPEMFNTGFIQEPKGFGESMVGLTIQWMQAIAKEKSSLICGSLIVKEEGHFYNRMILAFPEGQIKHYDKAHLFAFGGEAKHFTRGTQRPTYAFKGWRIRPIVCYDLRFPVWCRNDDDYDLLLNMASWPAVRSLAWTQLGIARAIENQAYYLAVNRTGMDGNGLEYNGLSQVVSYNGETLMQIRDKAMVAKIQLNLQSLRIFREKFPFLKDRDGFGF